MFAQIFCDFFVCHTQPHFCRFSQATKNGDDIVLMMLHRFTLVTGDQSFINTEEKKEREREREKKNHHCRTRRPNSDWPSGQEYFLPVTTEQLFFCRRAIGHVYSCVLLAMCIYWPCVYASVMSPLSPKTFMHPLIHIMHPLMPVLQCLPPSRHSSSRAREW